MLFRRIGQDLREHNWFAVALDFGIVVVGVFLAFQVDNWNQERIQQAEERDYLARLHDDISKSIERTQSSIDFMINHANRAGVVLRSVAECEIVSAERNDFANGLFHLGKVAPAQLISATIDELRSTKLNVLQDVALRSRLHEMLAEHAGRQSIFSAKDGR